MKNNSLKITAISLLLTCFIFSCQRSESSILSKQETLQNMEREDHQKCVDQGISYGEWGDITTEIYWSCRYNIAKKRGLSGSKTNSYNETILANLNRSRQIVLSKMEGKVADADHSRCLSMGFALEGVNDYEVEEYYKCREQLVLDRIVPAPKITHSYETSILPEGKAAEYLSRVAASKDIAPEVVQANNMINNYPICAGLNYQSRDFAKCADAQENSRKCLRNIKIETAKKNVDDKIYCQQQAFIQFPDNYAIVKNKSASELQKEKDRKKAEQEKEDKKHEEENRKNLTLKFLQGSVVDWPSAEVEKKVNPKEQTMTRYSKIELLRLREQFITRCDNSMEDKIPIFINDSTESCMKIAVEWDK